MNPAYRRAHIDADTLYVISEAVVFLAALRRIDADPHSDRLPDHELLHLLASLILHAQTWLFLAIEDISNSDDAYLTHQDITDILAGANPDPVSWCDTS